MNYLFFQVLFYALNLSIEISHGLRSYSHLFSRCIWRNWLNSRLISAASIEGGRIAKREGILFHNSMVVAILD